MLRYVEREKERTREREREITACVPRRFTVRTNFRSEAKRATPIICTIGSSAGRYCTMRKPRGGILEHKYKGEGGGGGEGGPVRVYEQAKGRLRDRNLTLKIIVHLSEIFFMGSLRERNRRGGIIGSIIVIGLE